MYYRSTGEGGAAAHDQVLGEVAPKVEPKTWWIEIPKKATRVEATIVHTEADGTTRADLDAQIAGVLQVNGLDVLRWLSRNANVNVMQNGLNRSAIICNWSVKDRWIDITPLVRKGVNNSVTYMHQDVKSAGVRIRYYDD